MAKRLSEKEKIVLVKSFAEGKTIDELAEQFYITQSTIIRHIKKNLGKEKYKELMRQSKIISPAVGPSKKNKSFEDKNISDKTNNKFLSSNDFLEEQYFPITPFTEIMPLTIDIDNDVQKDLASVPISDINLPNIVYMIVDKNIELEIKYLKEYPEWQFLSKEELNRKTIKIYFDLKTAKRICNKEQKVIKVPNTDVFKIASPLLLNKGISRIITADKLISL